MIIPEKISYGLYLWYMAISGEIPHCLCLFYVVIPGKDATLSVNEYVVYGNTRKLATLSVDVAVPYGNPG